MANAVTAAPRDGDAAYYGPANAAFQRGFAVAVDYGGAWLDLRINGERLPAYAARGLGITLSVPMRLHRSWRLGFVTAVHLPSVGVARLLFTPPAEPRFALLDNRANRAAVHVAAALAFKDRVALGVGAHLLAAALSNSVLGIGGAGENGSVPDGRIEARLETRASPVVSLAFRPSKAWNITAHYKGPISLPLEIDIEANVDIAAVASGTTTVALRSVDHYTPGQLSLGAAWHYAEAGLTVALDVTWVQWSQLARIFADLTLDLQLDTAPAVVEVTLPSPGLHDTVEARLGAEISRPIADTETRWALRVGYGLLPTPVPPQTGLTTLADATRHLVTLGAGIDLAELYPLFDRPLSIDLSLGAQILQRRDTERALAAAPFGSFRQAGVIVFGSLGATVRF